MTGREAKVERMAALIKHQCPSDEFKKTQLDKVMLVRCSAPQAKESWAYEPAMIIAAQGQKNLYLDGRKYEYNAGNYLALFAPMVIECEIPQASEEEPLLAVAICLDRQRLARIAATIEEFDHPSQQPDDAEASGILSAPISDKLLDASVRLIESLANPAEAAVIGDAIIDEIYYRIICEEQGGALQLLLRQQGQINQVVRAVDYLQQNLDSAVSVDDLAAVVNMSSSGFHKKFKEVMHVSPIQYTKLVRLNRARTYLLEGKKASEAAYMVGYNSPTQFSREYKRQFGVSPSAT